MPAIHRLSTTPFSRELLSIPDDETFRSTVGLEIGADVQSWHPKLDAISSNSGSVNLAGTTLTLPSGSAVLSLAGTANQISASASTGSVTLSIPSGRGLTRRGLAHSALASTAPDFATQMLCTTDGYFAFATGTGAGDWRVPFLDTGADVRLFKPLVSTSNGALFADISASKNAGFAFNFVSNFAHDSVGIIRNVATNGISGLKFLEPSTAGGLFVGRGNPDGGSGYANTSFIESVLGISGTTTGKACPLTVGLVGNYGFGIVRYTLQRFDTDGDIKMFKLVPALSLESGGVLFHAKPAGDIGFNVTPVRDSGWSNVFHFKGDGALTALKLEASGVRTWAIAVANDELGIYNRTASTIPLRIHGSATSDSLVIDSASVCNVKGLASTAAITGTTATFSGHVRANQQAWHGSREGSSAQTISSATWTDLQLPAEKYDIGGIFANPAATPTQPGLVHMNAVARFSLLAAGEQAMLRICKNGAAIGMAVFTSPAADTDHSIALSISSVTDGDDTFKTQIYRSSGGDIAAESEFQGWVL